MIRRPHRFLPRFGALAALLLLIAPALASAQVVVKLNDTVNFRFGVQLQVMADWQQDPNTSGYSQNFYLRRVRAIILATIAPRVTIFYETDNPRLGNSGTTGAKNVNTGFLTQDAFLEWRFAGDAAAFQAGLFLVPGSRNSLTSVVTFLPVDLGTWELQGNTLLQGNGGRDYGVGFNGYLAGDHLSYRMGVYDGARRGTSTQPAPLGPGAGSRNSFRYAVRLNYDFFDPEKGYTYMGTANGSKKIVAVGGWYDTQASYEAYGADGIVDWPIGKNSVKAEVDYKHFNSGTAKGFTTGGLPTVLPQNDFYVDAGFFIAAAKLQPFFKYESLNFEGAANSPKNQQIVGGGFNYYVYGQNLKLSALYQSLIPKVRPASAKLKNQNRFILQFQAMYF